MRVFGEVEKTNIGSTAQPPGDSLAYRSICLMATVGKLLERIILSMLTVYSESPDDSWLPEGTTDGRRYQVSELNERNSAPNEVVDTLDGIMKDSSRSGRLELIIHKT